VLQTIRAKPASNHPTCSGLNLPNSTTVPATCHSSPGAIQDHRVHIDTNTNTKQLRHHAAATTSFSYATLPIRGCLMHACMAAAVACTAPCCVDTQIASSQPTIIQSGVTWLCRCTPSERPTVGHTTTGGTSKQPAHSRPLSVQSRDTRACSFDQGSSQDNNTAPHTSQDDNT
jgi:hypothetical protein